MAEKIASLIVDIGAQVANLQKGLDQATGMIQRFGSTSKSLIQGVGQGIGQGMIRGIGSAIGNLPGTLSELVHRGEELGSIRDSFEAIGGSSIAIDQAKSATLGLANSFDLMKIANEGLIRGIPDLNNQFANIADYAARLADATGRDTTEAIQTMVGAIASGKAQMLAAQGIIVDTEVAYRKYADAHHLAADSLSKLQQKEAVQIEALTKVNDKLSEMPPITASVANEMDALGNQIDEMTGEADIALNTNEDLIQAFAGLREALANIDWAGFASSMASVAAELVNLASAVLPTVIEGFTELGKAVQASIMLTNVRAADDRSWISKLFGAGFFEDAQKANQIINDLAAQKSKLKDLADVKKEVGTLEKSIGGSFDQKTLEKLGPQIKNLAEWSKQLGLSNVGLGADIEKVTAKYNEQLKTLPQVESEQDKIIRLSKYGGTVSEEAGKKAASAAKKIADEAKKAADEVAKLAEQWDKTFRTLSEDILDEEIELEIKDIELGGKGTNFDKLIKEKSALLRESVEADLKEAVEKGAITPEQADTYADIMVERGVKVWTKKREDAEEEINKKIADDLAKRMSDALDTIESGLGDIASHFGFDIGDELTTIFKSTAVQAALLGLFKKIGAALGDVSGALVGETVGAALEVVGDALSAKAEDKKTKSNAGTGKAVGGAIGTAIGTYLGNPALGKAIGSAFGNIVGGMFKWGPQNPETIARHAFANYIEDQFKKLDKVSFIDAEGKVKSFLGEQFNFLEGASSKFNKLDLGTAFKKWGAEAENVFVGIGEALEEVLGLTEDVGKQIGYLLAENLGGNVDNARYLVGLLKLDMNQMIDALVEAGFRGEMSWLEVTNAIAGVQNAFKPGLVALGDFGSAFDHIIQSGGKGYDAIKALKDVAVEAGEAGINSFEGLQQALIAAGKDPEYVKSLFAALQAAGITSIQAISDASTQTLGAVIAGMESGNKGLADSWKQMRDEIDGIGEALNNLPEEKEIHLRIKADIDPAAEDLLNKKSGTTDSDIKLPVDEIKNQAEGGRLKTIPRVESMRTPGMERLSGGRQVIYNIDARQASPGVEENIMRALRDAEDRAVTRTLEIVASSN
jgi:hypothetical protein